MSSTAFPLLIVKMVIVAEYPKQGAIISPNRGMATFTIAALLTLRNASFGPSGSEEHVYPQVAEKEHMWGFKGTDVHRFAVQKCNLRRLRRLSPATFLLPASALQVRSAGEFLGIADRR
jgi:hypothetical protein